MELENGKNLDYWKDLQIIVEDEIHKLRDTSSSSGISFYLASLTNYDNAFHTSFQLYFHIVLQ